MRDRLTVVVCAYTEQRWNDLTAGLGAARSQLGPDDQVLLVIDHNEAMLERARAELTGFDVLANTRTRGLSGARNTALDETTGDIVIFLDDDAVPRPGWVDALSAPYVDPAVYAVGGSAVPAWPGGTRPAHLPPELDWVVGCSYEGMPRERGPIRNLMGCNMSFRREVFDLVGGFDENVGRVGTVPLGCEETQLCIRLRQARPDVEIVFEPAAVVDHTVSADRVSWGYLRRRSYAEGMSKAVISGGVGNDAISTELDYGRRVLPAALKRDARAWRAGDVRGRSAVAAIPFSLASFAAGYAAATLRRHPRPDDVAFEPVFVGDIDLADVSRPLAVPPGRYKAARLLVRDGRNVVGQIDVPVDTDTDEITADALTHAVSGFAASPDADAATEGSGRVAVVIASAGRPELVARCVDSVLAGRVVPHEIVLVDNGPGDADHAAALQAVAAEYAIVRYLAEPRPGASRARNSGVAASTADVIAFTDDDAVVDRWWLANLLREFSQDPDVGIVTGLVVPNELETSAQVWFENLGGFGKGFARRTFHRADTSVHALFPFAPGMVGSGNNMAVRRATWVQLGGMCVELGPGTPTRSAEDLDLYLRHLLDGGTVTYTPDAAVRHEHRRGEAELLDQVRGYGTGLSAMFTRLAVERPGELRSLATRAVPGVRRLLGASRRQTVGATTPPRSVARAELAGFARGPLALRRSRLAARSTHRS